MEQLTLTGNLMLSDKKPNFKPPGGFTTKNGGFTYIGVLIIVAIMMMALGAASEIWHGVMQRENEKELLFIGHQFRSAIGKYYALSNRYPPNLEVLLQTVDLGPKPVRFLRKIYQDPMTGNNKWGLVTDVDTRVTGVYSLSEEKPYKIKGFINDDVELEDAQKYSDWKFIYVPKTRAQKTQGGSVTGTIQAQPRIR
jgi:type II secretory pathway pseudopilin PulG